MNMLKEPIKIHSFVFNPLSNGGESVILKTNFYKDEYGKISMIQEFTLNSYGNCSTFILGGNEMTPNNLRVLASELQTEIDKIKKI